MLKNGFSWGRSTTTSYPIPTDYPWKHKPTSNSVAWTMYAHTHRYVATIIERGHEFETEQGVTCEGDWKKNSEQGKWFNFIIIPKMK